MDNKEIIPVTKIEFHVGRTVSCAKCERAFEVTSDHELLVRVSHESRSPAVKVAVSQICTPCSENCEGVAELGVLRDEGRYARKRARDALTPGGDVKQFEEIFRNA